LLDKIFEPFFTTKDVGEGTGLGLATVYGIVKQNNGFINVYSEPGEGTTFRIYLPRMEGSVEERGGEILLELPKGQGESVLVVEDEEAILALNRTMLEHLGYAVLTASSPLQALRQAVLYADGIDLLITDVIMPEMNGRDLAREMQALYPEIKVLFVSGYTENVIAHRGVLDKGVCFLPKPFSLEDLAAKVRETLGTQEYCG
jgi:CheY-like chemotaxis protein